MDRLSELRPINHRIPSITAKHDRVNDTPQQLQICAIMETIFFHASSFEEICSWKPANEALAQKNAQGGDIDPENLAALPRDAFDDNELLALF